MHIDEPRYVNFMDGDFMHVSGRNEMHCGLERYSRGLSKNHPSYERFVTG